MNFAELLLRVLIGAILIAHGVQKSMGWLQGPGLEASAQFFDSLGHRPGYVMVRVAAVCEVSAGVSVTLGLLTPIGIAVGASTLLVAAVSQVARTRIFWNANGGGEYPFVLAVVALTLGFSGPGAWSIDRMLFGDQPPYIGWLVVGVAALAPLPPAWRSIRHFAVAASQGPPSMEGVGTSQRNAREDGMS